MKNRQKSINKDRWECLRKTVQAVMVCAALLSAAVILGACGSRNSASESEGKPEEAVTDGTSDTSGGITAEMPEEPPADLVFETVDTDGNRVTSEEIFSANDITMVNCWATWCPPCVGELPELAKLNEAFKEKNCAIVGVLLDGYEDGAIETGQEIMEEAGVVYLNILPWSTIEEKFSLQYIPTTYFVDSRGNIIGDPVVGAQVDVYEEQIDALLEGLPE